MTLEIMYIADWWTEQLLRGLVPQQLSSPESQGSDQTPPDGQATEGQLLPEYAGLYDRNSELVGWIVVEGTNINYPVVQSDPQDPEFYLKHGFDKEPSRTGVPFLDAACSIKPRSTNLTVYAHNTNQDTLFSELMNYREEAYWREHPIIRFDTLYEHGEYEIISAFPIRDNADSDFRYYAFTDADDRESFDAFVEQALAHSIYDTGVSAQYGDRLLTLSTCSLSTWDGRMVIIARQAT